MSWELQPVSSNIIKSQAGAEPISAFRSSKGSGLLNERFSITKLGFHPSPLWGVVYLLIHALCTLPGRGWRRQEGAEWLFRHQDVDEQPVPATEADGTSNSPRVNCLPVSRG